MSGVGHQRATKLVDQLSALASMSPAQLRAEYERRFQAEAPRVGSTLIALALAYRLQEKARGGLKGEYSRQLALLRRQLATSGSLDVDAAATLKVGTCLVRDWGGVPHQIHIRDDGYIYRDRLYRSLSQIAREITGTSWSGPRFFGLHAKVRVSG